MKRERLPARRRTATQKISHGGRSFHVSVGFSADGRPLEVFAHGARAGSDLDALIDDACIMYSWLLQHGGSPLETAARFARSDQSLIGAIAEVVVSECQPTVRTLYVYDQPIDTPEGLDTPHPELASLERRYAVVAVSELPASRRRGGSGRGHPTLRRITYWLCNLTLGVVSPLELDWPFRHRRGLRPPVPDSPPEQWWSWTVRVEADPGHSCSAPWPWDLRDFLDQHDCWNEPPGLLGDWIHVTLRVSP